jgi:hypothetical protein
LEENCRGFKTVELKLEEALHDPAEGAEAEIIQRQAAQLAELPQNLAWNLRLRIGSDE